MGSREPYSRGKEHQPAPGIGHLWTSPLFLPHSSAAPLASLLVLQHSRHLLPQDRHLCSPLPEGRGSPPGFHSFLPAFSQIFLSLWSLLLWAAHLKSQIPTTDCCPRLTVFVSEAHTSPFEHDISVHYHVAPPQKHINFASMDSYWLCLPHVVGGP